MERKMIWLLALLLCVAPVRAQDVSVETEEQSSSWIVRTVKKVVRKVTSPNGKLDSAYVFQMPLLWTAGVETTLIGSTVDMHADVVEWPLSGWPEPGDSYGMDFNLQRHLYQKVGLLVGFGGLYAGYGVEVGERRKDRNTYFSLGLSAGSYGVQIQNYVINDYIEKAGGPYGRSAVSAYPGRLRDFGVDAYYVFNNRTFVYHAAYKGQKIQRRSVGSWMLSGRYLQGDLTVDTRDTEFLEITDWLGRYATQQISLGGGYSFNWVFLHRDPSDGAKVKGLRNLTLNLTALPMASFYTHVDSYHLPEEKDPVRTRFDGKLAVTFQAHAALAFCWDRFSVNVQVHHNRFGFRGASQSLRSAERGLRYDVDTRALFQDLTGKVQFYVRF